MGAAVFSIDTRKTLDTFSGALSSRHDAMLRDAVPAVPSPAAPSPAAPAPAAPAPAAPAPAAIARAPAASVLVIGGNALIRDCLLRCLGSSELNCTTSGYGAVADWQPADPAETMTILLCAIGEAAREQAIAGDITALKAKAANARIIVVSDTENAALVRSALEQGAQGYVDMSFNLDMAVAAIRLVQTGEKFVPVATLLSAQAAPAPEQRTSGYALSQRQIEVIDRLRRGEANKIIAYKLGMSESTVKIHIRNIMRKIKARNRTEVAILTKDMFE